MTTDIGGEITTTTYKMKMPGSGRTDPACRERGHHMTTHTVSVRPAMLCLRSEDAFVITCVANLMEVKVLYVQQDLRYKISSHWRFSV
jgi:hypothetical protein